MHRRPGSTDHASRPGPADRHASRTALATERRASRAALPWGAVVAGAGAVTLVVAAAGMVGAATGGSPSVVVPGSAAEGWDDVPTPDVVPGPDEPRPVVTRIPPPEPQEEPGGPAAAPTPPADGADDPATASPTTDPDPEPSGTATSTPTAEPSGTPTTSDSTEDPDASADATWVQERLRVHGATVEVTGTMDDATVAAVRAFQAAQGLTVDGRVGEATRTALAADPEEPDEEGTGPTDPPTPTAPPTESVAPEQPSSGLGGADLPSSAPSDGTD